jgi:acetoin utilization deacetylase AcuC-like enzyme
MPVLVISSPRFAAHVTPPGHPERLERAEVMDAVAIAWRERGGATAEPRPATREELLRVHDAAYVDAIEATRGRAVRLDPDTYTSPESYDTALLAAGAAVEAARHALDGGGAAAALVRPPGHHAERDRAMGFCLFNNVAVASADALARGAAKVAVVDIDVHHGNGTQWMFYADPRVLYVSTHQFPFYPGTGAAGEVGQGRGAGFTVNVPLEAGAGDADYWLVYDDYVGPLVEAFAPDLVLVSAGYDAHERDPLAGMRVTTAGYAAIVARLKTAADRASGGRIALVTEGGYDLEALAACLQASLDVLDGRAPGDAPFGGSTARGRAALQAVRAVQKPYWPAL